MKNSIGLIWRISALTLAAMFLEGMLTLGNAFKFEYYSAIAWIAQICMICIVIWGGFEWHEDATKSNNQ